MATKTSAPPSWDLSDLYTSLDCKELKRDITATGDRVRRFAKLFKGKVNNLQGDMLASGIKEYEDMFRDHVERLGAIEVEAEVITKTNVEVEEEDEVDPGEVFDDE